MTVLHHHWLWCSSASYLVLYVGIKRSIQKHFCVDVGLMKPSLRCFWTNFQFMGPWGSQLTLFFLLWFLIIFENRPFFVKTICKMLPKICKNLAQCCKMLQIASKCCLRLQYIAKCSQMLHRVNNDFTLTYFLKIS